MAIEQLGPWLSVHYINPETATVRVYSTNERRDVIATLRLTDAEVRALTEAFALRHHVELRAGGTPRMALVRALDNKTLVAHDNASATWTSDLDRLRGAFNRGVEEAMKEDLRRELEAVDRAPFWPLTRITFLDGRGMLVRDLHVALRTPDGVPVTLEGVTLCTRPACSEHRDCTAPARLNWLAVAAWEPGDADE